MITIINWLINRWKRRNAPKDPYTGYPIMRNEIIDNLNG